MTSSLLMSMIPMCFLILLFVGCHLTYGQTLCDQKKGQVDSSFMLDGDTFFKIGGKFWKTFTTNDYDVTKLVRPIYSDDPRPTPPERMVHFESSIKNKTDIDINQSIWGFNYRFLYNVCKENKTLCESHSPDSDSSFLCLYGWQRGNQAHDPDHRRTYAAVSYDGNKFENIQSKELNHTVSTFCDQQNQFIFKYIRHRFRWCSKDSLLTGWTSDERFQYKQTLNLYYVCIIGADDKIENTYDWVIHLKFNVEINETIIRPHDRYEEVPKIFDNWDIWQRGIHIRRTQLVIPMRFKDNTTILFNCMPNKCGISDQLDDNLMGYNTIDPESNEPYKIPMINMSVKKILFCPGTFIDRNVISSDDFCQRDHDQLDSSFMLDGSTFFKIKEKIWMSTFTERTNVYEINHPRADETFKPWEFIFRVDWFESAIKELTDINIMKPIWAFNYRFLYKLCNNEQNSTCKTHSPGEVNSFVCLYGYNKRSSPTQHLDDLRTHAALSFDGKNLYPITKNELKDEISGFCERQRLFVFDSIRNGYRWCSRDSHLTGWTNDDNWKVGPSSERTLNLHYVCIIAADDKIEKTFDWVIPLDFNTGKQGEMFRPYETYDKEPKIFDDVDFKKNRGIWIGRTQLVIPLRFSNDFTILFNCKPNKCGITDQLDDVLEGYNSIDPHTRETFKIKMEGLSLKKVLRCSGTQPIDIASDDLCDHKEYPLDSTFALNEDTFFKIRDKIWVMNSTKHNRAFQLRDAKMRVTDGPYKSTQRAFSLEKAIKEHTDIDIDREIWAFDYKYNYPDLCDQTERPNWCLKHSIHTMSSYVCLYGYKRVSNVTGGTHRTYGALSYQNNNFLKIGKPKLEKAVQLFCQNQLLFMQNFKVYHLQRNRWCNPKLIFPGWSTIDTENAFLKNKYVCFLLPDDKGYDRTQIHLKDKLISLEFNITSVNGTDGHMYLPEDQYDDKGVYKSDHYYYWKHSSRIIIPVHFSDAFIILNCYLKPPLNCHIYHHLAKQYKEWNSINPKTGQPHDLDIRGLTLQKLLRCPKALAYQKPPFAPQYFCHQKSFDSIFNLGDDIYFQNNGRFWRYYALSSTKESIPQYEDNIMNIRYDSYTTTLLQQYFNTSRIITGFSINRDEKCDRYDNPSKLTCRRSIDEHNLGIETYLDMTCIYGFNKSGTFETRPFINTPAGIEVVTKEDTHFQMVRICNQTLNRTNPNWEGETDLSQWIPISMVSYSAEYKAEIDMYGPRMYYSVFTTFHNPNIKYYIRQNSRLIYDFKSLEIETEFRRTVDSDYAITEGGNTFHGILYYQTRNQLLAYPRNKDFKILMNSKLYPGRLDTRFKIDLDSYHKWNHIEEPLYQLMNCTENSTASVMSYSLVSKQDPHKWICRPYIDEKIMVEFSVLNIGEYIYYQIEQRFYRYNKTDKQRFLYDKQVSELLNDLFETTKRVIGYSYKYIPDSSDGSSTKYRVVIMGRPRMHYFERLSNETHKRRVMYRVFEKYIGPLAPLVPINHLPFKKVIYKIMENPFGFVENFCKPGLLCPPPFSLEAEPNTMLLNAVAYFQYENQTEGNLTAVNEYQNTLDQTFLSYILESKHHHANHLAKALFSDPFPSYSYMDLSKDSNFEIDINEWNERKSKKFYGMFSSNNTLFIVGRGLDAYNPDLTAPKIYQASVGFQTDRPYRPLQWNSILEVNKIKPLDVFFDCVKESPRQLISGGNHAMIFLFIFLVIALIVILIVLGIMAFMKYGSHKQKSETKEANNTIDGMSSETNRNKDTNS